MRLNFSIHDIIGIVRRRFFFAVIPALIVALVAFLAIREMPPIYESQARILVQDQQISRDYVEAAGVNNAREQVEIIRERVLARENLLTIADELNLYTDEQLTPTERAARIAAATTIEVTVLTGNNRRRANEANSILVRIVSRGPYPGQAYRVANKLVGNFEETYFEEQKTQSTQNVEFLQREENALQTQLSDISDRITSLKAGNAENLPENRPIYERALARASAEAQRLENAISESEQQIRLLQLQLPLAASQDSGPDPDQVLLTERRRALDSLRLRYQDTFPDVISMRRDVMALEKALDPDAFRRNADIELARLNTLITETPESSPQHSDLVAQRASIQDDLRNLPDAPPPTNISEMQINVQITSLRGNIERLQEQRAAQKAIIEQYEARMEQIPAVEASLFQLEQEREQLRIDLAQLQSDVTESQRTERLVRENQSLTIDVVNQPARPDSPISPNKPQLAVLGLAMAGIIGAIIALAPEVLFPRVHARHHIAELAPNVKVIEVPRFEAFERGAHKWIVLGMWVVTGLLTAALGWSAVRAMIG